MNIYARNLLLISILACLFVIGCVTKSHSQIPLLNTYHDGVWNGEELLIWDGQKGYALNPYRSEWSYLPKNPYTNIQIHQPRLLHLGEGKILAVYWKSKKNSTLCFDYYYSDKKLWERVKTFSAKEITPPYPHDPNGIHLYIGGMVNMSGTAVICIESNYEISGTTCLFMDTNGAISFFPFKNDPLSAVEKVVAHNDKLLYLRGNRWSVWDKNTESWRKTTGKNPYSTLYSYTLSDNDLFIFGGSLSRVSGWTEPIGWIYSFTDNTWRDWPLGQNSPGGRRTHGMCWTGKEIIIWGGTYFPRYWDDYNGPVNWGDGYIFNPTNETWEAITTENAPSPRFGFYCVWTGKEMIIWGGYDHEIHSMFDGHAYNPKTKTWRKLPSLENFIKR